MASKVRRSMFTHLEGAFRRVIGQDAISQLQSALAPVDIITIGGDQLTGKSTLSRDIASQLNANYISAGTVFRAEAKEKGVSVGELSKMAKDNTDIDELSFVLVSSALHRFDFPCYRLARIEYATCRAIMAGYLPGSEQSASKPLLVIEGRNPGVMAAYCRDILGKKNIVSIYLSCSPRLQALRFLKRELPPNVSSLLQALIGQTEFTSLAEAGKALKAAAIEAYGPLDTIPITIDTEDSASIKLLAHHAVNQFLLNQSRDDDDRARFLKIYDFPADLDYRNPALYDLVLDTTLHTPVDTLTETIRRMKTHTIGAQILDRTSAVPLSSKL